jgi:hypothetical protein
MSSPPLLLHLDSRCCILFMDVLGAVQLRLCPASRPLWCSPATAPRKHQKSGACTSVGRCDIWGAGWFRPTLRVMSGKWKIDSAAPKSEKSRLSCERITTNRSTACFLENTKRWQNVKAPPSGAFLSIAAKVVGRTRDTNLLALRVLDLAYLPRTVT